MGEFCLKVKRIDEEKTTENIYGLDSFDEWTSCAKLVDMIDDNGKIIGVKLLCDRGHGYGFNYGENEVILKLNETYCFTHRYTSIDGPTDWEDHYFEVEITLLEMNH